MSKRARDCGVHKDEASPCKRYTFEEKLQSLRNMKHSVRESYLERKQRSQIEQSNVVKLPVGRPDF